MRIGGIISLTTDFGTRDWFVGTMKAVIAGLAPNVATIDITHEIPSGDIRAGAFALSAACHFFPKGSVHVAVVDPGVGSSRGMIAVQTANHFFVGPDNGVLSLALRKEKIRAIRTLENPRYFVQPVSHTFHGRDIFAPVAAHLSRKVPIQILGRALKDYVRLDWPEVRSRGNAVLGEVIYVDRFGTAITNVEANLLSHVSGGSVFLRGKRLCAVASHYQAADRGQAVAVPGSSGFLEIAVNGSNAAQQYGLRPGVAIEVRTGLRITRAG